VDEHEVRARFEHARVARLATVDADGRPHLVPVCFALDRDTIVSAVDAKPKTTTALRRLANVRANPAVSLLVDHYDDVDWTRLWWARADGDARVVEDGAEHEHACALLVARYTQYRDAPPRGPVVAVAVRRWRGWAWRQDA
jgi:PPOX class probable F420-dependent enzyme